MKKQANNNKQALRFAIYARYSSEMQNEMSIEAQIRACREEIKKYDGMVVAEFKDSAKNGWSLDREGFQQLRAEAQHGRFDAVMVWKFDRLARDLDQANAIKHLLRKDYGLKIYCVQGVSEDDDEGPHTMAMEQMLAVFSAFYSKNLSSETKRGKRERAIKGEFNGSVPPIGYYLVKMSKESPNSPSGIFVFPRLAAIVRRAFKMYSTGKYSDGEIATWMNERPIIKLLRHNQQPLNKETVRDMLQNRVYIGEVPHTETIYRGTLGQRRASRRKRSQWFTGKHMPIISKELFDECQAVRAGAMRPRNSPSAKRIYILHDRVFCAECISRKPPTLVDDKYGLMRPKFHNQRGYAHFHCLSQDRGYEKCNQPNIPLPAVEEQVVHIISNLNIPGGYQERIEDAIRSQLDYESSMKRIEEIKEEMKKIDFQFRHDFLRDEEYVEERQKLKDEINALRPLELDVLEEAADLLQNFKVYWNQCTLQNQPDLARQQLLSRVVSQVFVDGDRVIALALKGNMALILGEKTTASSKIAEAVSRHLLSKDIITLDSNYCGSDGIRTRDLCLDRAIC